MLPRKTYPDYGSLPTQTPSPGLDFTEIPARFGCPATLRRSGKVYWYDVFDDMNAWAIGGSGGAPAAVPVNKGMFGPNACELTPGSSSPYNVQISMQPPLLGPHPIGIECNFQQPGDEFSMYMFFADGSYIWEAMVRIDTVGAKVQYLDSTYNWIQFATIHNMSSGIWHNIKMTADFNEKKYKYLAFNDTEVFVELPLYSAVAIDYSLQLSINYTNSNPALKCYVDYVILTLDEF